MPRCTRLFVALAVFATPAALAQADGVITGTVTDAANKGPVPDVVVTATSPALQAEQLVVTDSTGTYRIPQLPPGTYSLRFEREGYKALVRNDIVLRYGQTLRANLEMLPEALQAEEIVVRAPTVDVGSTVTGINVNSALINDLALARPGGKNGAARSFEALAELAPGAHPDAFGVSLNGTTSPENQFFVDGISVNDLAYGTLSAPLSLEFLGEVNIITGGYLPEFGRATGGVLNVLTKSGSNEFHGSVFGHWSPGVMDGPRRPVLRAANSITTSTSAWNIANFGFELGGPIIKDKLWFYAGFSPSFTRYRLQRSLNTVQIDPGGNPVTNENGIAQMDPIPGTQQDYFADQKIYQWIAKLTYQVAANHRASLSFIGTPSFSGGGNRLGIEPRTGRPETDQLDGQFSALAHTYKSNAMNVTGNWSSSFLDKHLLFDATAGLHNEAAYVLPSDGSRLGSGTGLAAQPYMWWQRNPPRSITYFEEIPDPSVCDPADSMNAVRCPVASYVTGGPRGPYWPLRFPMSEATANRFQLKAVGTYLAQALGHHIIKAGVDLDVSNLVRRRGFAGGIGYNETPDGQLIFDFPQYGYLAGPDQPVREDFIDNNSTSVTTGVFLQESWNILDKVTVNAGLRFDTQKVTGIDGSGFSLPSQFSPRLGAIYDFTQSGRSKIFVSYAKYYESMPLNAIDRFYPGERFILAGRGPATCDPRDPNAGKATSGANACQDQSTFFGPFNGTAEDPDQVWGSGYQNRPLPVDPNLKAMSTDEIVAGAEYEVIPATRLGVTYLRRTLGNAVEDLSRDGGRNFFLGNPGYGMASDFPKAERNYDSLTLHVIRSFSNQWFGQAMYTYASLRGNYNGLFRPETGQLEPNTTSDFDLLQSLENKNGQLPGDITHSFKIFGAKEYTITDAFSTTVGVTYFARSGAPTNYLGGGNPIYGPGETFVLPRGSGGRLPWVHSIDARLGLTYKLSGGLAITGGIDIFNLFNFQAITSRDENYTFDQVSPQPSSDQLAGLTNANGDLATTNPNFRQPTSYQAPRSFRFNLALSF